MLTNSPRLETTTSYCLLRNRLYQRLAGVVVEHDIDLRGQVVGQVEQLLSGRDGHQDDRGPLLDGHFHDVDGVVERVDGTAQVQAADNDQAAAKALVDAGRCTSPGEPPCPGHGRSCSHRRPEAGPRIRAPAGCGRQPTPPARE